MNKDLMFSSKTDIWETPKDLFDTLNKEFNFTLDVCALPENAKCEKYYTPENNGLSQNWDGIIWCNPPYGRQIGSWVRRALFASVAGNTVVMLLPARTDTRWFHEYIYNRENVEIRLLKGRLRFGNAKKFSPVSVNGGCI